jgi:bacteriorhodopsin
VRTLHANFAWVVVAANLVAGIWGLIRHRRKQPPGRSFWIALAIAWGTIFVQGAMGLTLFQDFKPPFKHTFYGFLFVIVMLLVWPLRGENARTTQLVFSAATLFIGIVAVRAVFSL